MTLAVFNLCVHVSTLSNMTISETSCLNFWFSLQIVKESYVDHTQFDSKDPHYDS